MTNYEWLKTLSLEDMASAINDAKLNGSRILASSCRVAYHTVALRLWLQEEHSDQKESEGEE